MNWIMEVIDCFIRWYNRTYHKARGCNGEVYHNGMCECECRTHYLGL